MSYDPSAPPADFTRAMKGLYSKTRRQLRDQGTWQDIDASTLAKWVRAEFRAADARESLRHAAAVEEAVTGLPVSPDALTVKGSKGQEVAHPLQKAIREAEQDSQSYARDLLMTAAARAGKDVKGKKGGGKLGL